MLRTALAAALAAALTSSAARAVEVEYYNASPEWARKMGQYFEEAPAALKSKMFGAHVIVVSDLETLAKVQRRNGSSAADIKKFSESDKYNALASRGVDGVKLRSLTFIESAMRNGNDMWNRKSMLHEMSHLLDYGPSCRCPMQARYSGNPAFVRAWRADKADYEAHLRKLPPDKAEVYKARLGYYFTAPEEAFADISARLIEPLSDEYRGTREDFLDTFSRSIEVARPWLVGLGIIGPDADGRPKAKPAPRPQPQPQAQAPAPQPQRTSDQVVPETKTSQPPRSESDFWSDETRRKLQEKWANHNQE